jgi:hypothetical protein
MDSMTPTEIAAAAVALLALAPWAWKAAALMFGVGKKVGADDVNVAAVVVKVENISADVALLEKKVMTVEADLSAHKALTEQAREFMADAMKTLKDEMKEGMVALRAEMKEGMASLRNDVRVAVVEAIRSAR